MTEWRTVHEFDGVVVNTIPALLLSPLTWVSSAGALVLLDQISSGQRYGLSDLGNVIWNTPAKMWAKGTDASIITLASIIAAAAQDIFIPQSLQFDDNPKIGYAVDGVYVGLFSFPIFWLTGASSPFNKSVTAGIVYGGGVWVLNNVVLIRDTVDAFRA